MKFILDKLRTPELEGVDIDEGARLSVHSDVLERKRMLRDVFIEFHHLFNNLNLKHLKGKGLEVELGAGVAPIKDSYPNVLATDIVPGDHLDKVVNAESMEFLDSSVRVIYGQNCFHHFPHPDKFFLELDRVLVPGGGAILLEPYYGPFASFLFKRLFKTEGFDKGYPSWETPAIGPMNGANQALSYIIFMRDRRKFEHKYPDLEIVDHVLVSNYMKYLFSGGLNFRQLLPDFAIPLINLLQRCLNPFNKMLALHHVVVIRKVA